MQLTPPIGPEDDARDLATAIRSAHGRMGAAPVVTVLFPGGRQEQGMTSLAQWAAKGAHLLELDLLLEPGDTLHLDAPVSWTSVAVAYAAWWSGVTVCLDATVEPDVTVRHELRPGSAHPVGEVLLLGDRLDGSPDEATGSEAWVRSVQTFPDQPPLPRATPSATALVNRDRTWTQEELLATARTLAPDAGTVGLDGDACDATDGIVAAAVRPLVRGRPTVVLRGGVPRTAAAGDRVAAWL